MASGFVKSKLSTCRHGRPQVTCRQHYKSVLLLVFGLILWKWMNGGDSLGSNQECRTGCKHSHSRVSQSLASIRKLGNIRSSEGLRVTKWIKSCLLQCFGTFKMPILMFISILVFRPEGQIWNPVRRDTRIYVRRILNASRISKTQLNSCTISPS